MKFRVKQTFVRESTVELKAKTKRDAIKELKRRRFEFGINSQLGDGEFDLIKEIIKKREASLMVEVCIGGWCNVCKTMCSWDRPCGCHKTIEEKRNAMIQNLKSFGINYKTITCDNCDSKTECEYAYDSYNTDGDCLAVK